MNSIGEPWTIAFAREGIQMATLTANFPSIARFISRDAGLRPAFAFADTLSAHLPRLTSRRRLKVVVDADVR